MEGIIQISLSKAQSTNLTGSASPQLLGNTATLYEPDVKKFLNEYKDLEKVGQATEGMCLTLHRCYPTNAAYKKYKDLSPLVLNGKASVAVIDSEGQLITLDALEKGFTNFISRKPTFRNLMWLHSNQQIGVCLPVFKTANGQLLKSRTNASERSLYVIGEVDGDHSLFPGLKQSILEGVIKDYSIGGRIKNNSIVRKFTSDMRPYLEIGDVEISEVTLCPKGVNPDSPFRVIKADTGEVVLDRLNGSGMLHLMRNTL